MRYSDRTGLSIPVILTGFQLVMDSDHQVKHKHLMRKKLSGRKEIPFRDMDSQNEGELHKKLEHNLVGDMPSQRMFIGQLLQT